VTSRRDARRSAGYFGVAIWHPKTEANVGTLWRSSWLYGAAYIATIGRRYQHQAGDTVGTPSQIPLMHFDDLDDMLRHQPWSCPLVGIELDDSAVELPRFQHPRRATYLLGAEDHGLPRPILEQCHSTVSIPAAKPWSMNVSVAGSIVMYDRWVKAAPVVSRVEESASA
jgi:tRNA G18 (ribose-2'-O)-methylase SpoU